MRLAGKRLLMLIADGVQLDEYDSLRRGFEAERATVLTTAPEPYGTVETVSGSGRGPNLTVDIPLDGVEPQQFEALVIPDGIAAIESLRRDRRITLLIRGFHERSCGIFASGTAIQLLKDSGVLPEQILVREGEPVGPFIDRAVSVLLDAPFRLYGKPRD